MSATSLPTTLTPSTAQSSPSHSAIHNLLHQFANQVVNVTDSTYGATGDGTTDDTAALQAAAAVADSGGIVFIPAGTYLISDEIDWGSAHVYGVGAGGITNGTTINVTHDGIGFKISGSYGEIADIHFDGSVGGENAGAIAVVVEAVHKPKLTRCTAKFFTFAGFAFSGAQNMLVEDCFAQYNLYNLFICNNTRNIQFLNCNASDFDPPWNAWMAASDPECRAVRIGQEANSYITQLDGGTFTNTPSRIMFRGGIFERFGLHDYIVEISHGYDNIVFDDCEFTLAKTAYISAASPTLAVVVLNDPVFRSSTVPLINNPDNVGFFVNRYVIGGTAPGLAVPATMTVFTRSAWVRHGTQNPPLGTIPVYSRVISVTVQVLEAFNSDGADEITVGYDGATNAFATAVDVSTTGIKSVTLGSGVGYIATARAAEAYYVNGGSEPTTGEALVTIDYAIVAAR